MRPVPTAPIAAGSFVLGYAFVAATGSRALGGVVLLIGGAWCAHAWLRRHDGRTAGALLALAFCGFIVSHLLGLLIGAWPAVLLVAATVGAAVWVRADARAGRPVHSDIARAPTRLDRARGRGA
jgi:hypothetical protein